MAKHKKKRKKVKRSKMQSQDIHARKRFFQRFNIILTKELKAHIVKMIQRGFATHVEKQTNRISLFDVYVEGKTVRVVYDKHRHNIVSALWPEGIDGEGKRIPALVNNTEGGINEQETRIQVDDES